MRPGQTCLFVGTPRIGVIQFHASGAVEIFDVVINPDEQIRNYHLHNWRIDFRDGRFWIRTREHIHCFRFNRERQGWDYAAEVRRGGIVSALIFATLLALWWAVLSWISGW